MLTNGNGCRFFWRPSKFVFSPSVNVIGDPIFSSQQKTGSAVFGERNIAPVALLKGARNPCAILWAVVLIVVLALKGKPWAISRDFRPSEKALKCSPLVANFYVSAVIVSISLMVISASADHRVPNEIEPSFLSLLCIAVLYLCVIAPLYEVAAARFSIAVAKGGGDDRRSLSTVTDAHPHRAPASVIGRSTACGKAAKSLALKLCRCCHDLLPLSKPLFITV